ncbi:Fc.00g054880.m01.CDS01 [Cosmosporella sp. VM-42]
MAVVTSLATAAAMLGDLETAQKHMDGLHRMIELRGGLKCLGNRSMIEHKAQRIDLGLAMRTGSKMRFVRENISWGPQVALGKPLNSYPELRVFSPELDTRLLNIWSDLQDFSKAANKALETKVKMPAAHFSPLCTTVPQRLVSLKFDPTSLQELLRLSMLAYIKNLLIQIEGLGKELTVLANGLKTALLAQHFPPAFGTAEILLWSLTIASLAVFESLDQDWLRMALVKTCSSLSLQTWTETRIILKRFLWLDMVYDKKGKRLMEMWVGIKAIETNQTFSSVTSALF